MEPIGISAALTLLFLLILLLRKQRRKEEGRRVAGIWFTGLVPDENSIHEVVRWSIACWSVIYGEEKVRRVVTRTTVHFFNQEDNPTITAGAHRLVFDRDARKTDLATFLSNEVVLKLEPTLDKIQRTNRIAEAWISYPKDYN